MLLAIDIGNTNTVFAIFNDSKILTKWRIHTNGKRTSDEYYIAFDEFAEDIIDAHGKITKVYVSSVVPKANYEIKRFAKDFLKLDAKIIGDDVADYGIKIAIDRPSEAGSDRILNSIAGFAKYKSPLIILDFGTATTFDVVGGKGEYLGGVIAPGINLSLEALQNGAAKLPKVNIRNPKKVIGKNTHHAMQSGFFFGYLGLIEGIISKIKKEQKSKKIKVIATGGLAPLFAPSTDAIDAIEENLILDGIRIIANKKTIKRKTK
jgi:type III pantothenate kinase